MIIGSRQSNYRNVVLTVLVSRKPVATGTFESGAHAYRMSKRISPYMSIDMHIRMYSRMSMHMFVCISAHMSMRMSIHWDSSACSSARVCRRVCRHAHRRAWHATHTVATPFEAKSSGQHFIYPESFYRLSKARVLCHMPFWGAVPWVGPVLYK